MTVLATLLSLLLSASSSPERPLHRYLFAIASEDGGPGKARLRYSGSDARGVAHVMQELGGIAPERVVILSDPDSSRLLSEFRDLSVRMARSRDAGNRVELMTYYSGHSDEAGLLLGSTRLPYSQLRASLQDAPADVRLAILDACASGAALRSKGGNRREAFRIEGADRLRGQAFLSSSRAQEASQESDRIGGSFFTQAFLAGLRGAADADRDGRVTLLEAYRYAYDETVASTASTRSGPQHPEYDLELSGSGEVVLTDLNQAGSLLELDDALAGRIVVADSTGRTVAELRKAAGSRMALGLPEGVYRVRTFGDSTLRTSLVSLPRGARVLVAPGETDSVSTLPSEEPLKAEASPDTALLMRPVNFGLLPPLSINATRSSRAWNLFSLDLLQGDAARVDGLQIAPFLVRSRRMDGLQVSSGARAEDLRGLQVGAFAALADKRATGMQTGLVAWSGGSFVGLQTGLLAGARGPFTGMQAGLLSVTRGPTIGLQAGLVDVSKEKLAGTQIGVGCWSESVRGAQLTVLNVGGSVVGVQAGVVNIASSVRGAQIGVLNFAGTSEGAQIGVLNLAGRAHGAVVGVASAAREMDALPISLLGVGLDMRPGVELLFDEARWSTLALRLDGRRFHTRLGGLVSLQEPDRTLGYGFGFGAHCSPWTDWTLETDLFARQLWHNPEHGPIGSANWNSVSVSLARRLGALRLFGGLSGNVIVAEDRNPEDFVDLPDALDSRPTRRVRVWPGVFAGARF